MRKKVQEGLTEVREGIANVKLGLSWVSGFLPALFPTQRAWRWRAGIIVEGQHNDETENLYRVKQKSVAMFNT